MTFDEAIEHARQEAEKEAYNKALSDVLEGLLKYTKPTAKYIDSEIIVKVLKQLKK